MRTRLIPTPWKNGRSWASLLAVLTYWLMARLFQPASGRAVLPGLWLPPCPLKAASGIPCPFCGITTGSAWLARGQWANAWHSNPLSPILILGSAVVMLHTLVFRFGAGRSLSLQFNGRVRYIFWIVAVVLVAGAWAFNLTK